MGIIQPHTRSMTAAAQSACGTEQRHVGACSGKKGQQPTPPTQSPASAARKTGRSMRPAMLLHMEHSNYTDHDAIEPHGADHHILLPASNHRKTPQLWIWCPALRQAALGNTSRLLPSKQSESESKGGAGAAIVLAPEGPMRSCQRGSTGGVRPCQMQ